ncbi:MAG: polysaccharide deacetylase family protein [Burkholderiaceae bacterium]|nr:polysaccharide deacetylase family protein [Burkholderiaceae bacterium]
MLSSFKFLKTANADPIPILVYHQIDAAPAKGAPFRSLYVSPAAFARQMAFLKLLGYTGLSMTDMQPYLSGEKKGKVVGITFDDGYLNNLTHALPVLQKNGFTSTCYMVDGLLGQTNSWDMGQGIAQTPLMTAAQLVQWQAGGQEVGAHTQQHVDLLAVSELAAWAQIAKSKPALEAVLQQPVNHFCYPFGKFDTRHETMAKQAGYTTATTTVRGRVHADTDMMTLPRVPVLRSTSLPVLWLKVATGYEDRDR